MRKNLGSKRKEMGEKHIKLVTQLFGEFVEARLAIVTGEDGNSTEKLLKGDDAEPMAPKGGKVRVAPISRIFKNEDFGYRTITVERPLRDEKGKPVVGQKGRVKGQKMSDSELRDTENVPLSENIHTYFEREVLPHVPDAWIDEEKTRVGYEMTFNRHFYVFEPPRSLDEIDADLKMSTDKIRTMLEGLQA
jgi:type I restriction enzyme M protein